MVAPLLGIRLLGAVLLILSGTGLGRQIAARYGRRVAELEQLQGLLAMLASEIDYALTPLPEALARVGRLGEPGPARRLFERTAVALGDGSPESFREAWSRIRREEAGELALTGRDDEILEELGWALGASAREDQLRHLALAAERLKAATTLAERLATKNAPLTRSLGILGGILLALLLF